VEKLACFEMKDNQDWTAAIISCVAAGVIIILIAVISKG